MLDHHLTDSYFQLRQHLQPVQQHKNLHWGKPSHFDYHLHHHGTNMHCQIDLESLHCHIRHQENSTGLPSLMIEQGENIKYIQTQLGHSTPTVTLNIYAHLMKSTNQEAAIRLEKAIF